MTSILDTSLLVRLSQRVASNIEFRGEGSWVEESDGKYKKEFRFSQEGMTREKLVDYIMGDIWHKFHIDLVGREHDNPLQSKLDLLKKRVSPVEGKNFGLDISMGVVEDHAGEKDLSLYRMTTANGEDPSVDIPDEKTFTKYLKSEKLVPLSGPRKPRGEEEVSGATEMEYLKGLEKALSKIYHEIKDLEEGYEGALVNRETYERRHRAVAEEVRGKIGEMKDRVETINARIGEIDKMHEKDPKVKRERGNLRNELKRIKFGLSKERVKLDKAENAAATLKSVEGSLKEKHEAKVEEMKEFLEKYNNQLHILSIGKEKMEKEKGTEKQFQAPKGKFRQDDRGHIQLEMPGYGGRSGLPTGERYSGKAYATFTVEK